MERHASRSRQMCRAAPRTRKQIIRLPFCDLKRLPGVRSNILIRNGLRPAG